MNHYESRNIVYNGIIYMHKPGPNQHYVPRFYLRYFSADEEKKSIYMYDKGTQRPLKKVGISDVAAEDFFYDLKTQGNRDNSLDQALTNFESKISSVYLEFMNLLEQKISPTHLKKSMAEMIAITCERTKHRRKSILEMNKKIADLLIGTPLVRDAYVRELKVLHPGISNNHLDIVFAELEKNIKSEENANWTNISIFFGNREIIEDYCKLFLLRDWKLLIFDEEEMNYGFWTSDTPVIWHSNKELLPHQGLGYGTPDTDIIFPLSSKYCLVLSGEGLLKNNTLDQEIALKMVDKIMVDKMNILQYTHSSRFIFPCSSNSFLIRILKKRPLKNSGSYKKES